MQNQEYQQGRGFIDHHCQRGKIPEVFDTDIFIAGRVFYLKDIPSKKISEAKVDSKGFFMPFVKSRVSVQFQRMSKEQADQLAFFLKTHATIEDISEA